LIRPIEILPGLGPWHPTDAVIVERSMDPSWLSNAYLVADRAGGTAVFVDSGAPIDPLVGAGEAPEVQGTHLLPTDAPSDHIAHHDELESRFGTTVVADPAEVVPGAE